MVTDDVSLSGIWVDNCYWMMEPIAFTTWESAIEACKENGGQIASVLNETHSEWLAQLINK